MILQNYSVSRGNKLSKFAVPQILEQDNLKDFWMQSVDLSNHWVPLNQKLHKHTFFEVHIALEGENRFVNKQQEAVVLHEGEAVVFAPLMLHANVGTTEDLKRLSFAIMISDNSSLSRALQSISGTIFKLSKKMISMIDDIYEEIDKNHVYAKYIIRNKVFELLVNMSALSEIEHEKMPQSVSSDAFIVSKAKKYIKDNTHLLLTCNDVATYCHFNEVYLNRIFKKHTGDTLLKYIHDRKIEDIQNLLHNQTTSLKTVSSLSGFQNEFYFNAFFKRLTGISPGEYRMQLQQKREQQEVNTDYT